ncbi:MAG: DUF481 domain-containing protein [Gammaproteobacteria bacterium]|nr:DUF481 domain-containing protein [Gammaproteobacteria bacterium]
MKSRSMNFVKIFSAASLLVFSSASLADEGKKSPWKSSAELGYVHVSGNTNTETVKAAFDISYEADSWAHKAHAEALSSKSETTDDTVVPEVTMEERTAAKWLVSAQSDYKFKDYDYFYGLLSYEDDRFSGFEYQAKIGLGYGRRVIHTENHELRLEIGPGYRTYRLEQAAPPALAEETRDETLIRANAGYTWKLSETSKFTEDLTYEAGEDQDEWKSVTGLTAKINSTLAMKISHTVKHLEEVPAGSENYDRETAVTLVFTF